MRSMRLSLTLWVAVMVLLLACLQGEGATSYNFTKIADTNAAIPAHALRVLCHHGSGQLSQRFAHPFPSLEATCVIRHDGMSCGTSAHLVL